VLRTTAALLLMSSLIFPQTYYWQEKCSLQIVVFTVDMGDYHVLTFILESAHSVRLSHSEDYYLNFRRYA
jgi:hypothetical protein